MGGEQPAGSERPDTGSAGDRPRTIVAQNTGRCVEDGYPDGAVKLHLGSGRHRWDGWINVDFDDRADIQCDLKTLPFEDGYADVAVAVHVIEHFYQWEALPVLLEWRRVLKPGGKLILELPSMDKVLRYVTYCVERGQPPAPFMSWLVFWGDPKHKSVEMCHKWGYTTLMLKELLLRAGFTGIEQQTPRYHFPFRDMRVVAVNPSST